MNSQKKLIFDNIKRYMLDIFFPNRCPFCDKIIKWNENCCEKCFEEIPYIDTDHCRICGQESCICKEVEVHYDGCVSIVYYKDIIKNGMVKFKTDKALNLVDVFESDIYKKLGEMIDVNVIDVVTSVPMNKFSKRERGYNQADIIAKKISKNIKKPLISDLLIKTKDNIRQHELTGRERRLIVKDLFKGNQRYTKEIRGKTVLLCDDIITTGSTLNECASVLKQYGAKAVYCITIASTKLTRI